VSEIAKSFIVETRRRGRGQGERKGGKEGGREGGKKEGGERGREGRRKGGREGGLTDLPAPLAPTTATRDIRVNRRETSI